MAISVVQSTNGVSYDAGSISLTLNGVQAGSALILCVNYSRSGTLTQPDAITGGTTFTQAAVSTNQASNSGYNSKSWIYYALNVSAGNKTVTVPFQGEEYATATLTEVRGLASSNVVDGVAVGGSGNSNAPATGSFTSTQAETITFAVANMMTFATTTMNVPSGWTLVDEEEAGGNYPVSSMVYRINAATGAQQVTWAAGTSGQWTTALAVFKADTGGAGVSGSANLTLSDATVAASAQAKLAAALTYSLAGASVAGAAVAPIAGVAAVTLADVIASGAADNPITGAGAPSTGPASLSATGAVLVRATASPGLAALSLSATGTVATHGALAAALTGATLTASGGVTITGSLVAQLAGATVSGSSGSGQFGQATLALDGAALNAAAVAPLRATASIALAAVTLVSSAALPLRAQATLTLAGATASGAADVSSPGSMDGTFVLDGAGVIGTAAVKTHGELLALLDGASPELRASVRVVGGAEIDLAGATVFGSLFSGELVVFGRIELAASAPTRVELAGEWSATVNLVADAE